MAMWLIIISKKNAMMAFFFNSNICHFPINYAKNKFYWGQIISVKFKDLHTEGVLLWDELTKNDAKFASWEMGGTMYFWHLQEYKSFILYYLHHYDGFHAEMQLNANAFGKMLLNNTTIIIKREMGNIL